LYGAPGGYCGGYDGEVGAYDSAGYPAGGPDAGGMGDGIGTPEPGADLGTGGIPEAGGAD
jgi:hypothetical protein